MKGFLLVKLVNQPFTLASSEEPQLFSATSPVLRYFTLHRADLHWAFRDTRGDIIPIFLPLLPDSCELLMPINSFRNLGFRIVPSNFFHIIIRDKN